ncbi:hypothetical protein KI387_032405, partial [Taxus chinensis]
MGQRDATRIAGRKPIRSRHVSPAKREPISGGSGICPKLGQQRDAWDAKSRSGRRQRRK